MADHLGDLADTAHLYSHRSALRLYQGNLDGARRDLETCAAMARKSGSVWSMLNAVGNALMIAATEGNAVKAARIHGALEAAWERMEMSLPSDARRILEPYIAAARTQLGDVVFEKAWEAGRDLSLDDAIAYALEERVGSRVTHCRCAAPYRMHLGSRWQVEACAFGEGRDSLIGPGLHFLSAIRDDGTSTGAGNGRRMHRLRTRSTARMGDESHAGCGD